MNNLKINPGYELAPPSLAELLSDILALDPYKVSDPYKIKGEDEE